jgi:cytochrome c-type biogenesis protein CcmH/NrfG
VALAKPAAAKPEAAADTGDPLDLVRRGEKALERGAVQAAESAFQRALEIDPHMPRAKTGLGYVALERNQPNAAIAYFRPAAQHGHAEAFIGMGDAYRRIGHAREALDAYQTYLKRFPDGPRRSIAQHQSELLSEQLESGH